ncbi:MAG TPA: hypothetical protein VF308_10405 [Caldimonas sp.]
MLGTAGLAFYVLRAPPQDAVALTPHTESTLVPSAMNVYTPKAETAPASVPAPKAIAPPAVWLSETNTLRSEYQRFKRLGTPAAKLAAYKLAEECKWEHTRLSDPGNQFDATKCGDLEPGDFDDGKERLALLIPAALNGEPGAWWRLVSREGPRGVFKSMPAGPEYDRVEEQAHLAALKAADPLALAAEYGANKETDPAKALAQFAAFRYARQVYSGGTPFDPATETPAWAKSLPASVQTKAIAEGQQFAASAIANRSKQQ